MTMKFHHSIRRALLAGAVPAAMLGALAAPAFAQEEQEDEQLYAPIIVTGTIRQGGAQDIRHFREISFDGGNEFMPPLGSLTMEGLLGEHDLTLPRRENCRQTFCLVGHAIKADLPLRPQDAWFVGLDFDSNIDAESWKAAPLSLVAVVDRSGSMDGAPIAKVKEALLSVVSQMGEADRFGIVLYGSTTNVHLPVMDVAGHRGDILNAIDSIQIDGSTYLEAGLKLGYDTAYAELPQSRGKTRLMLFTDENPNVGNTSAAGFMAQASAGSARGVGLTTIGVGVHYDGALAARVSSAPGGNLFFIEQDRRASDLFDKEFRNMTSEVAQNIAISMTPPEGYAITGVFGVPDGLMTQAQDGTVTVTIGTAFLSSNGGGIYASLGRDSARDHLPLAPLDPGSPLLEVKLAYVDAVTGKEGGDRLTVTQPDGPAPARLGAAMALVDEYVSLTQALDQYHVRNDKKAAFATLDGLDSRLSAGGHEGFGNEEELIGSLRDRMAYLAGYRGEVPAELRPLELVGRWKVTYFKGVSDVRRGDVIEITNDNDFITYPGGKDEGDEIWQSYQVNERQLFIPDGDLLFQYRRTGDRLTLRTRDGEAEIAMRID
ncbi:vWA domain-containing protein [Altererythrobacter fulvus]|uniref:vWA domain-containing protein n=1 Tax=Caenibius fulvus TaxID=2126012 RepID=UPI003018E1A7